MDNCIFCKIVKGEIPSTIVYESDNVLAFKDINPVSPIHIIVVTKAHIESIAEIDSSNSSVLSEIFEAIAIIAKEQCLSNGYRVVSNVGNDAGQTIDHLHFHLLGGRKLSLSIC